MKRSAGILLYQINPLRYFIVHPGGPFWKNKDLGAWSIPKGEYADGDDAFSAALREFEEETGHALELDLPFVKLKAVRLKSGKTVEAWATEYYLDAQTIKSNTFEIEWPPKSGRKIEIPEVDRAEWFEPSEALRRINEAQRALLIELQEHLALSHQTKNS